MPCCDRPGDARAAGARAVDDDDLVAQLRPRSAHAPTRPASATAPVPWMSSLNDGRLFRYRSRTSNAVSFEKSSHWTTARGQRARDRVDDLVHEREVLGAAEALLANAEVRRALEEVLAIGPTSRTTGSDRYGLTPPATV